MKSYKKKGEWLLNKFRVEWPWNPARPLLTHMPQGTEKRYLNNSLYVNIHSSTIHSRRKVETTQMSNGWIHKIYIHTMEYYSAIKKNEVDTCYNLGKP